MADIEDYGSSGRSRGGARSPPLFLDQTEGRRAEKIFFCDRPPPPLSQGLDDRPSTPYLGVWMTAPPLSQGLDDRPSTPYLGVWMTAPPLSRGLDDRPSTPYLKVWIRHWVEAEVK